ncbi:phenylacetone monooxygenase [Neobacillus niacini]|uniref:flavin-containing monooxygenase n=1 Tax=Neobacillus niacini TaxID=86668 RepID=UPI00285E4FFC|nr:NAD(P)/FAD-dependent oxidoreductase [Neobacillus niacini]MDR7075731.1 phenylacetone monooxygenase [Neobacillus niacini]
MNNKKQRDKKTDFDAVITGAGFAGLYMLHSLREQGLTARVYDTADNVGGVWYWNRYPGAHCDSEAVYYGFTFSEELYKGWTWSKRYAPQPEILDYLNYVADTLDLRKDIKFNTRVNTAEFDEEKNIWRIETSNGSVVTAKYFISGVGCLSASNVPNIKGLAEFKGEWYHTGRWPHTKVDFTGKRVGVIGTGSSGMQLIPEVAKTADHLTVFQRTPQYTTPAGNRPLEKEYVDELKANLQQLRNDMLSSPSGQPFKRSPLSVLDDTPEAQNKKFEEAWEKGLPFFPLYNDILTNEKSNEIVAEFVRKKIGEVVKDQDTAKKLMPNYYFGTKRPVRDSYYYETFNRENVSLVDVKYEEPIQEITENGVRTKKGEYELDMIIFATGYDAMTGSLIKFDLIGKDGITLKEKWENGASVSTYLGIAHAGFPNFFTITGPESPSVITNVPTAIEQHVEWISKCIQYMEDNLIEAIEADSEAEKGWSAHCREMAESTLYVKTESWYTGANIEGKPRGFLIYVGGLNNYKKICDEVAENGYKGFSIKTSSHTTV